MVVALAQVVDIVGFDVAVARKAERNDTLSVVHADTVVGAHPYSVLTVEYHRRYRFACKSVLTSHMVEPFVVCNVGTTIGAAYEEQHNEHYNMK